VGSPSGGQVRAPDAFQDHAWFVAFAPVDAPTIAVAVLVEHGGKGGAVAAPVARQVIEAHVAPQAPAPPAMVTDVVPPPAGAGEGRRVPSRPASAPPAPVAG
jgi:penicillin-binding protein 2